MFIAPEQIEARMRAIDKARQTMQEKYTQQERLKAEKLQQV